MQQMDKSKENRNHFNLNLYREYNSPNSEIIIYSVSRCIKVRKTKKLATYFGRDINMLHHSINGVVRDIRRTTRC